MSDKLTKKELASKLGISRPTLDKYLEKGFPKEMSNMFYEDNEYEKILLENEIRLLEYQLKKYKSRLQELEK